MLHLLRIEWLKIKRLRAFFIIIILFVVFILLTNYLVYSTYMNLTQDNTVKIMLGEFNPFDFSHIWQTSSYISGYLISFPAILLIILIGNEFNFKTSRQNIIDGLTRKEFYNVKIVLALLLSVFSTIIVILTALIFGLFSSTPFSLDGFSHIGFFFLKSLSYNGIALFMSFLIRRTGIIIALFFGYLIVENIISRLLDLISIYLKFEKKVDFGSLGGYLPLNASDALLTFPENPFSDTFNRMSTTAYSWLTLLFVFFYLILFYQLGKSRFLRKDL